MATHSARSKLPDVSVFVGIALGITALYFAQEVLIPLALAILLAFLLAPLVTRLERRRFKRVPAVLTVAMAALALVVILGWIVGDQFVRLAENLPQYQGEIVRKARRISGTGNGMGAIFERLINEVDKATSDATTQPAGAAANIPPGTSRENPLYTMVVNGSVSPLRSLSTYIGPMVGWLGTGGLVIVFVLFILLEREDLRDRMIRLISRGNYTVTTKALDDAATRISRYILMQTIVNSTYGLTIAAGLWVIGLAMGHGLGFPSFVLWGVICFMLRFVPYLGPWIAASFPIAISLAVFPGFGVFFATVGWIVFVELLSNNVMEPWLYGASTGLSTVSILVAAVFWTWLWGWAGLLMSTPLTVCIVVLGKYVTQLSFLDVMLSDQPALPPQVTFYQRLLASDPEEALKIARDVSTARGSEHVADEVFVPALLLARRDRRDDDLSAEQEAAIFEAVESIEKTLVCPPQQAGKNGAAQVNGVVGATAPDSTATASDKILALGCPAHHRSEEIVLKMIAAAVDCEGVLMQVSSTHALPVEVEARVARENPSAVVIGVIPPGGITQARYLSRRLRRRFPELKIIVSYLGRVKNFDRLLVRLRSAGATYVTTSLVQTRAQLKSMAAAKEQSLTRPDTPLAAGTL